jgi:hypothetical protein
MNTEEGLQEKSSATAAAALLSPAMASTLPPLPSHTA